MLWLGTGVTIILNRSITPRLRHALVFMLVGWIYGLWISALLVVAALAYGRRMESRQIVFDHDWHALERLRLLTGFEFERHVAELYSRLGYRVELTRGGGDQGVDVIAQSPTERIGIQCKQWSGVVGNDGVQEAIAGRAFYNCSHAALVCTSTFTAAASELASRANVQLIDGQNYAATVNRFRPLIQPVGAVAWIPRGRAAVVQASMFAAALLIFVLHFAFQNGAGRFQRAAAVLERPVAIAPYYAPATTAPYVLELLCRPNPLLVPSRRTIPTSITTSMQMRMRCCRQIPRALDHIQNGKMVMQTRF